MFFLRSGCLNVLCRGCVNLIMESLRDFLHCKYLAHFCVVGCKERGGGPYLP